MTVNDLLQHPVLDIPKDWREKDRESYYQHVIQTIREYTLLVDKLDDFEVDGSKMYMGQIPNTAFIQHPVRNINQALIHALQRYFNQGSPSVAYKMFAEFFAQSTKGQQYAMLSPDSFLTSKTLRESDVLYRLRSESAYAPDAAGMFHIPFDRRYLVANQRFSISGYPCLYAASSVHLAYKELRNPGWTPSLYAAKLKAVRNEIGQIVLLDLRNHVSEMRRKHIDRPHSYDGQLMKFFATWPLVMATSVPVRDSDRFHEEYVIPQLVLEWVNTTSRGGGRGGFFSGIAFSSSRLSPEDPTYADAYNVVIPAHSSTSKGLCPVRTKQIQVSSPITIESLDPHTLSNAIADNQHAQLLQDALQTKEFETIHPYRG
ncbi:RES domain-containing protein [Hymenobacter wooponensis]|uniref:Uncharacterized protein n=1 Tax=Hymenobacter wooponensis TaxID=1525360 RepID=A0A4Z0MBT7_9BACT|nr:RES domain-containing protein [Hymenobacter wooponensis]TGD76971.1 hypothetical protein EU557_24660 [Hymenobacter wooponensis]